MANFNQQGTEVFMSNVIQFRAKKQTGKAFHVSLMTDDGLRVLVLFADSYRTMVDQLPKTCNRIISTRVN